jgi:D-xylose transport system permease protein
MSETVTEKKGFKIETSSLRAYTMIVALALIWLFFHWQTGGIFLTALNLSNLMTQMAVTGVIAVGMLIGSVVGLAGGCAAIALTNYQLGLVPSLIVAVVVGVVIGIVNGTLVAYANIPAFIVTLGGLLAWRGVIKGISNSETIPVADAGFKAIGQSYIAPQIGWVLAGLAILFVIWRTFSRLRDLKNYTSEGGNSSTIFASAAFQIAAIIGFIVLMNAYAGIPIAVMILLIVAILGVFITNYTTFGRYLYAIGGNPDAARLSGIDNKWKILQVYALLGALVGVAALIFTARVGSAAPDAGVLKELDAIAACVIGGASLMGGRGTIFGAMLGALIMASLDNGMSLLNVRDYLQDIIKGSILVAAVGLDMVGRKSS